MSDESVSLLEVTDLAVSFPTRSGELRAVDGVSFRVETGRILGIVGESGSGKSVTCLALMGLTDPSTVTSGRVAFKGTDLLTLNEQEMQRLRGNELAMIFQDPMTSLNPVRTIGVQLAEAVRLHDRSCSRARARLRAVEMLGEVGIPHARTRLDDYPHQFSGGMRQRAMIAMALINNPDLLIADEPTTALDVTTQAQVLELMTRLQDQFGSAIILVTHDLGVIAEVADDVLVMYGARVVEEASVYELFDEPAHPYTWGLMRSAPSDAGHKKQLLPIGGQPPSLATPPPGCRFHPRCEHAFDRCRVERPMLEAADGSAHRCACWLPVETRAEMPHAGPQNLAVP